MAKLMIGQTKNLVRYVRPYMRKREEGDSRHLPSNVADIPDLAIVASNIIV